MNFRKYQHVERFGTSQVLNIELGTCYIFPKIDGTNTSVWLNDGQVEAGSRNRKLQLDDDHYGFYKFIINNDKIKAYLEKHPTHRLYGEWLVPHTLKTYRQNTWRKFYIFDVCIDKDEETVEYIPYDIYKEYLEEFELDYIVPLKIINNGDYERFIHELDNNIFLIEDGKGVGEGIVIKNYDFYNQHGLQIWAKIVTSEFREKNHKSMGAAVLNCKMLEQSIVDKFVTTAFVEKEFVKIVNDNGGWDFKLVERLFGTIFHELITEEMWNIIKDFKNPTINFRTLRALTINKIKQVKSDIF